MEIQAQFPPPKKATNRKVKTTKQTKIIRSNSIYFEKTNIRHTRTIILKIPAIFLISMNIRKTKILLYYLQQNIFKPQISHLLTEHSDL